MRPIFSIHAGEYLVCTKIEESFPSLRVWIPSKDTGIDLLVTDSKQNKVASLQVKFSKDYHGTGANTSAATKFKSGGWWKLKREKIADSTADFWVMVLYQFQTGTFDFVVIPPRDLLSRYNRIGRKTEVIQSFISITSGGRCWETRNLNKADLAKVCAGEFRNEARELTSYLNAWPF